MKNITKRFTQTYHPFKSIIIYRTTGQNKESFIEAYDFSPDNKMINAHPLSLRESQKLGKILCSNLEKQTYCFEPSGVLPSNVLYVNSKNEGKVVWFTPASKRDLLFNTSLGIASGAYYLPALLWKATKEHLYVFALKSNKRPTDKTAIFKAPFFNIHESGQVCMGTVDIDVEDEDDLQSFINHWENYFFNSHFSHLLGEITPIKGNIVQLCQSLQQTGSIFPLTELIPLNKTVKNIIHENE
ncbi:MAG: PRTRC system protein B [Sediminibacterium sp.]|nr:PRTRC system protein B [Sediminibacterium sp.]